MLMYLPTRSELTRSDEVVRVEVHVLDVGVELGGDVVAQPLRVHAEFQVASGSMPVPRLLLIFSPVDGDEAVHEDVVRRLAAAEMQHRRPEQGVEVGDVLADEVDCSTCGSAMNSCVSYFAFEAQLWRSSPSARPGSRSARPARRRSTCPRRPGSRCRSRARRARCPSHPGCPGRLVFGEPLADLVQHLRLQRPGVPSSSAGNPRSARR
jgi:hypothetical protein